MSSKGPLIDADDLRKKVSGIDAGFMPASLTCDAKFVIWATTRHGRVTGESGVNVARGTVSVLCVARSTASRSASSSPVVVAAVAIFAAPAAVWTHQASAVRR